MRTFVNGRSAALLLIGAALGLPAAARAQFQTPSNAASYYAGAKTQAAATLATAQQPGFGYSPYAYGGGGWGPWGTYIPPTGAALMGAADVVGAQGQFAKDYTQANLMNEQVRQAKIDTQRKQFDEKMYEKAMTPTLEDEREKERQEALKRARNDPPLTEIIAGRSLNTLLFDIQKTQSQSGLRGPDVPLDENTLKRINFTDGTTRGNPSMLRNAESLQWPRVLAGDRFAAQRKKVDAQVKDAAYQMTAAGQVSAGTQDKLLNSLNDMKASVKEQINDLTPDEYIGANRYLNQLLEASRSLDSPNAANFFNGKWTPKAQTVAQLVDELTAKGLTFAPASRGDESSYRAIQFALLNYDNGLARLASR
jgi:hypothetical protein